MKFQSTLRKGLVIAGAAFAMILLAGSVQAQEITNTQFNDGPNVAALAQPVAPQQTATAQPTEQPTAAAADEASMIEFSNPAPKALFTAWLSTSLLVCIGLITMYAIAEAKRGRKYTASRSSYLSTRSA